MTNVRLPTGLASLVHHVELCQAGWHERSLDLILKCALFETQGTCQRDAVPDLVNDRLPTPLGLTQVEDVIKRLLKSSEVLDLGSGTLKLSEEEEQALRELSSDHRQLEDKVKVTFSRIVTSVSEGVRPTWSEFESRFLTPLVLELGARTYEFVSGASEALSSAQSYLAFAASFSEEHRSEIAQVIEEFLDPKDSDVRAYVLGLLNAAFLVQATALSSSALESLAARTSKRLSLAVLVDTNFLFSLLGLHENPADDVVEALKDLIERLHERLDVRLYILPSTLDEAQRTIAWYASDLSGLRMERNVATAVIEGTSQLSGIAIKFVREAMAAPKGLTTEDYFAPYLKSLLAVARDKGVELYNEPVDGLRTDQAVIDDVLAQMEYEATRKFDHPKSYESMLHDMVLWHFVRNKRPERLDSYLEAKIWATTIDFRLLGFDRHKTGKGVPVCIHPTVLLHVLQLWIPRSRLLDSALLSSLRPLMPHVFDRKSEKVTIDILRAISRFENVGDLSNEVVTHILFDGALRSRVAGVADVESQIELVREALVEETKRLEGEAVQLRLERSDLEQGVAQRDLEIAELRSEVKEVRGAHTEKSEELESERARAGELEDELLRLQRESEHEQRCRRAWGRLAVRSTLFVLVFFGGVASATSWVVAHVGFPVWVILAGTYSLAAGGTLLCVEWSVRRQTELTGHWVVRLLIQARKGLWVAIWTVAIGLLISAVWESIRGGS